MQIAIDNAKRKYNVDLEKEIPRINKDMDVQTIGLPDFWEITKKDKRKARTDEERKKRIKENKTKIKKSLNHDLVCPMNYLQTIDFETSRSSYKTIPMENFIVKYDFDNKDRRKSKMVEEFIEKYSLEFHKGVLDHEKENWKEDNTDLLLRADFDELISDINKIYISRNYQGLMWWLINRAFKITKQTRGNMDSNLSKNKSLLLKVLYTINPEIFLNCFVKKQ